MATESAESGSSEVSEGESADGQSGHLRGLIVTATAALGGVAAGVASSTVASGATPTARATDRVGLIVLAGAVVVELVAMRLLGVEVSEFSTKDQLYVVFMTFALWFVTWTVLLTTA